MVNNKQSRMMAILLALSFGVLAFPKPNYASSSQASSLSRPLFIAGLGDESHPFFSFLPQFRAVSANSNLITFNLNSSEMTSLINSGVDLVSSGQVSLDKLTKRDARSAGQLVRESVDQMIRRQPNSSKIGIFEKQWVTAEVVCELVKRSVRYDYDLAENPDTKYKEKMSLSTNVLSQPDPKAECWGFAVTTRDIARAAGLECYLVNGHKRELGEVAPAYRDRNHSIACFIFDKNFQVPADVTATSCRYHGTDGIPEFGGPTKILSELVLPRDRASWELFLARFNAEVDLTPKQQISGDQQNKWLIPSYSYEDWANSNTSFLKSIEDQYIAWERKL